MENGSGIEEFSTWLLMYIYYKYNVKQENNKIFVKNNIFVLELCNSIRSLFEFYFTNRNIDELFFKAEYAK